MVMPEHAEYFLLHMYNWIWMPYLLIYNIYKIKPEKHTNGIFSS